MLLEEHSEGLDQEGRRLLELIRGNAGKMDRLILYLLSLSRLGRGERALVAIDMSGPSGRSSPVCCLRSEWETCQELWEIPPL
jgi:signal transduction histidine kinase